MSLKSLLAYTLIYLSAFSKQRLLKAVLILREKYVELDGEKQALSNKIKELEAENLLLKSEQIKKKVQTVNQSANQPTSKQPEWETKGVGNDGKGKKKGRGKKGRKGAGNKPKDLIVTHTELAKVERCNICGRDLSDQPALESVNMRMIEDMPEIPIALKVIEVTQEKKYCRHCKKVVTARSELALPKSDIGINTTVSLVYLWVALCLPFTRISGYLKNFFGIHMSTSGLSNHIISVAKIMKTVYEEILHDVKSGNIMHADETGWRVSGANWWLWVFGTRDSAFFTIDKSRGQDVVRRVLGATFFGVLVVDGWSAYLAVICSQQSCMAHLLRKIRKLHAAFPKLSSVYKFYIKFRKILRDGERLQTQREKLGEKEFKFRLGTLHARLDHLLKWDNPNDILKDIIAKVERQRSRILTFVEHPGVPCHNNFGEFLIRIGVLKRKVSFGSKSAKGADAYAVLLTIYCTCKLRGVSFECFMKSCLKQYARTQKILSLREFQESTSRVNLVA